MRYMIHVSNQNRLILKKSLLTSQLQRCRRAIALEVEHARVCPRAVAANADPVLASGKVIQGIDLSVIDSSVCASM